MTHIACFSGGESSAIVAIEVVRKFGKENVVLLNHDISSKVEDADVKRFKKEISNYLGLPITYANHADFETFNERWETYANAWQYQQTKIDTLQNELEDIVNIATELAEYTSYAEIVDCVQVNRVAIRKYCDMVFDFNNKRDEEL